jgi:hypothetical protein
MNTAAIGEGDVLTPLIGDPLVDLGGGGGGGGRR